MQPDVDKLLERFDDPRTRAIVQRLRDLPEGFQPPYDWTEFQRRSAAKRTPVRAPIQLRRYAAIAASFTLVVAAVALWSRFGAPEPNVGASHEVTSVAAALNSEATRQAESSAAWLGSLEEPVVVRVGSRMAITEVEDRIAYVDDLLSAERVEGPEGERSAQLQRERERLVHSLVRLRYAETLMAALP